MTDVLFIDGLNLLWRYCSVMPEPDRAAGAFMRAIVDRDKKTTQRFNEVVVVLEPMEKKARDGDYKAHRKDVPEDHLAAHQIVSAALPYLPGVTCVTTDETLEADSLIAGFVLRARELGKTSAILTSDKDLCQLVKDDHPSTYVMRPERDWMAFREAQVKDHYGVPPNKIPVYLSLMGDKSDNIAGIPGWGKVNATKAANAATCLDDLQTMPLGKKLTTSITEHWDKLIDNFLKISFMEIEPQDWPTSYSRPDRVKRLREAVVKHHALSWALML